MKHKVFAITLGVAVFSLMFSFGASHIMAHPLVTHEHFLSYQIKETKNTPKFDSIDVGLTDQFVSGDFKVKKIQRLLNPVDKNQEGLFDAVTHFVGYQIQAKDKNDRVRDTIAIKNQFGVLSLDIKNERLLLVPSSKAHDITPEQLKENFVDHYKCYDVKVSKNTPKFKQLEASVYDPNFNEDRVMDVKKPRLFCNPVEKFHNNESSFVNHPEEYLVCYDVRKDKGQPNHQRTSVFTNNQFGPEELDTKKEKELCVPSEKINYVNIDDKKLLDIEVDPEFGDTSSFNIEEVKCKVQKNNHETKVKWCKAIAIQDKAELLDLIDNTFSDIANLTLLIDAIESSPEDYDAFIVAYETGLLEVEIQNYLSTLHPPITLPGDFKNKSVAMEWSLQNNGGTETSQTKLFMKIEY